MNLIQLKPKISLKALLKPKISLKLTLPNLQIIGNVSTAEYVATEDITAFDLVTVNGAKADSNNLTHRNKVLGMSTTTTLTGFTGNCVTYGEVINPAWTWVIGDILYLNGLVLSTTPPIIGFSQEIAKALTPTIILIDLNEAILI
jgi:hypothetical protein